MDERQKLAEETREYLSQPNTRQAFLLLPTNKQLMTDLAHRVLNRRGWHHGLKSFDEVLQVVSEVALQESRLDGQ